ncbi:triacylglycerol lipase [Actinocorallia sp. API 0066]|uniref:lipase family protein n=1 Tax=Actinocorallia sp. API 0066 TaxID=2896846 RepID=UPI001E4ACFB1|nr:lipase family protein [Actinocorallia sp. API 0066]MCD0449241.1 triacylglycerol lipase [Actinocorallia sp. API 0066]
MARHAVRRRTRKQVLPITGTLIATALLAVASTAPAQAAPDQRVTSRGVVIPAFYTPPKKLPKKNGTLIRTERLPLAVTLSGVDGPLPGRATRLMYKSTDANGKPVAVTGAYLEPTKAWRGKGPRPLVALGAGTMGQGDQCAPSFALEKPILVEGETMSVGYEDVAVYRLLSQGVAVVVTDYVGLGATDRLHTYAERFDQAHALLDAVRAAFRLPRTSLTAKSPVGLYGYSQGGGASAAAAELKARYAPEIRLAGTYAGAPPADLAKVIRGIDGSALAGALGWSINGLVQNNPELRRFVNEHVNAKGKAALKDLSTMCVGDAIFGYAFARSGQWTKDGRSLSAIIAATPAVRKVLARERLGSLRPSGPVRVATGVLDDIVPHGQARRLAADWCARGAKVTYQPVNLPNLGDKLLTNHFAPLLTDQSAAISWLTDRLHGKPARSNCAAVPKRP